MKEINKITYIRADDNVSVDFWKNILYDNMVT
jgi:hypothetical protein